MWINNKKKIYYINRYDLHKPTNVRDHSGYEQIVKYSGQFCRIEKNYLIQKLLQKILFKKLPKGYLAANLSKEFKAFIKVIFSTQPVLYLYADKDAFLLPLLKRKLKLKWIKIYGTLHWPPEKSNEFSFYRYQLVNEFNGVIGLSSTIQSSIKQKVKIIPHGIDLAFWKQSNCNKKENLYLLIGISNRNHLQQKNIINEIKSIDFNAKFILIINNKTVQEIYKNIPEIQMTTDFIFDYELKCYYEKAKAIILFQNHCLASNVVLEAIAMQVPIITNLVGDINEYLGDDYPLFINDDNKDQKLREFCLSSNLSNEIIDRFKVIRNKFDWTSISKDTIEFIEK